MFRNLVNILLILLSISYVHADDDLISSISIDGTKRIDKETIVSYANVEIGQSYTEEFGNEILKDLFDTDLFSNIEISFFENTLSISVIENPTVNLVKFKGNKKINDEDLLVEISLKERSVYSRSKVKKDIERMLTLYQRSGRLSTEINPTAEMLENNRINLTYEISESDIAEVAKIIFLGNNVFSSSELKSEMRTKEKTILRFYSSADRYDPDKLEFDKQLITQFYNNRGYPDFKFLSSIAQLTPNSNNFEILLTVDEGEKFNFGRITVTSQLSKMNEEALLANVLTNEDSEYNESKIEESISIIKDLASIQGYSFIEINPKIEKDSENGIIDLNYIINEGPRVYVNTINIQNNTRTVDRVIRREMSISEGDAYNKYAINYSKDSIRALDFFSSVDIKERNTDFPDKLDLDITVEEKNTGEASLGAGYSSSSSATLTLGLKENNFLGKGQKLNFTTAFSDTRSTYDISFTEPYFNGKNLSLTSQLYSNFSDPSSVNYETEDLGLGFSVGFPISPNVSLNSRYSLYTSKTKADAGATAYERLLSGTDTISMLGYSIYLDKRNSRYKPSNGYNIEVNQDIAGLGGTSYYFKNSAEFNTYKKLSKKLIGSFKFQFGNVNGYNGEYAPLSSNFKLGGKKLRGFKQGKIGPRTGNSFTGGQYYYVTSLETNIDFDIDAFDITSTLFLDAGSVWGLENPAYSSIDDDHEMRSSIGVNFNWDSAIGPINIIYANILESETTDTTDNLYFDIGYNF